MWSQALKTFCCAVTTGKPFAYKEQDFTQRVGRLDKVHSDCEKQQQILFSLTWMNCAVKRIDLKLLQVCLKQGRVWVCSEEVNSSNGSMITRSDWHWRTLSIQYQWVWGTCLRWVWCSHCGPRGSWKLSHRYQSALSVIMDSLEILVLDILYLQLTCV